MSKPATGATASASAAATPVDLKSAVKVIQGHLASQKPAEAAAVATPLLQGESLEVQAAKDGKQKPLAYTLCAFAGLAYAQTKAWEQAEATFLRATRFDEGQFPAWKGLYDVYTQQGAAVKDKLRGVLEKLVDVVPANTLKKLTFHSQLLRMQLELPAGSAAPSPTQLAESISWLLSDPALTIPADSKDKSKDTIEVTRLTLELRTSALLACELCEAADKAAELRIRLERQLKKYREERDRAEKLRAQQSASKSGQVAAAVGVAKGVASVLTQAEEEADITRRVLLRLEKDFAEKSRIEEFSSKALATPAPSSESNELNPDHLLVHEHALNRIILSAHVAGAFTPSATADEFNAALSKITSKAEEIVRIAPRSAFATRVLVGLRWNIGLTPSREQALSNQTFFAHSISLLAASDSEKENAWIAWNAMASCIVATETVPDLTKLPVTPELQQALTALGENPSPFEVAETILRNVQEPVAAGAVSSAAASAPSSSSSAAAASPSSASASSSSAASAVFPSTLPTICSLLSLPSPLVPSFLAATSLAEALQRQGESKHKECLSAISSALASIKQSKSILPHDARLARCSIRCELSLAATYGSRTMDERQIEQARQLYLRTLKSIRESGEKDAECEIRALQGLVHCALHKRPPDYAAAEGFVTELVTLAPQDAGVRSVRGFLALQEAREMKSAPQAAASAASVSPGSIPPYIARLRDAASFLLESLSLSPNAQTMLRLGEAYFEQSPPGFDETRRDPSKAKQCFDRAAEMASNELTSLTKGSLAQQKVSETLSMALAYQGSFLHLIALDPKEAKSCWVRALKVDPSNPLAGEQLCILLNEPGKATGMVEPKRLAQIRALVERAIQSNSRCVWALIRLARMQVREGQTTDAIASYQNALRVSSTDEEGMDSSIYLRELAECYSNEGQFIAAFKSISRAVELSLDCLKSNPTDGAIQRDHELNLYLLAKNQLVLGGAAESVRTLEGLLGSSANPASSSASSVNGASSALWATQSFPARKLLVESLYVLANQRLQSGAVQGARETLDRAVLLAENIVAPPSPSPTSGSSSLVQQQPQPSPDRFVSMWKLMGDSYSLYNSLPATERDEEQEKKDEDPTYADLPLAEKSKLRALSRALSCYMKASSIDPSCSEYLFDGSLVCWKCCLALRAPQPVERDGGVQMHPLETQFRTRGIALIKAAIVLSPSNSMYWILLSLLDPRPLVSQHALIKSIQCDPSKQPGAGSGGWTHLGLFYLQNSLSLLGEHEMDQRQSLLGLSRHALELAQTLDPSNPLLWLAQALFNKHVSSFESFVQSKACFQRSIELFPSFAGRFGVAYTSYCTGDLSSARGAVGKFTEQYPSHATGWNLRGVVSEQIFAESKGGNYLAPGAKQLVEDAVESFEQAEALLKRDPQLTDESQRTVLLRHVRMNRARTLASAGRIDASLSLYQELIREAASALAMGGAIVLAQACALHVELALVYASQGEIEQSLSMIDTSLKINTSQIASAAEEEQLRNELILARRKLYLQQAQFHAQIASYPESKSCLRQSVSEFPESPHPLHYFQVMTALYAVGLQEKDQGSIEYAVEMMNQCVAGLQREGGEEEMQVVQNELVPTLLRIKASIALLQNDLPQARRMYQKLIALNPTSLERWNDLFSSILASSSSNYPSRSSISTILSMASVPTLETVHVCRLGERAYFNRVELVSLALLALGRVGTISSSSAAAAAPSSEKEESKESELLAAAAAAEAADDEVEYNDELDDNIRAKPIAVILPPNPAAASESQSIVSNLTSDRLATKLIVMDPTRSSSWGVKACSLYAQAVQASVSSEAAVTTILFSKAIKALQFYTSLLTAEMRAPPMEGVHQIEHAHTQSILMSDLCYCQILLVDSMLRRSASSSGDACLRDVEQATLLLQSIAAQRESMGAAFPLAPQWIPLLSARLLLRQGNRSEAMNYYRAAIESNPLSIDLWEELAEAYTNGGQTAAAEACLQAALQLQQQAAQNGTLNPAASQAGQCRLFCRLSLHAYAQRNFAAAAESAARACKECGEAGASSPAAFFMLGLAQAALQHPDQAMRAFQQSLNLHLAGRDGVDSTSDNSSITPSHLRAAVNSFTLSSLKLNLALLFIRSSNGAQLQASAISEAKSLLEEELHSSSYGSGSSHLATIYYQLALIHTQMNDIDSASKYVKSALQLRPTTQLYLTLQRSIVRGAGTATGVSSKGAAAGGANPLAEADA